MMTERPFPWSREVYALLLDRLFAAGARLVLFDLVFNPPNEGDAAFHAALDRYRGKVVLGANFDAANAMQAIVPNKRPDSSTADGRSARRLRQLFPGSARSEAASVHYTLTDRQLAGQPPHPSEEVFYSLSARGLGTTRVRRGHARAIMRRTSSASAPNEAYPAVPALRGLRPKILARQLPATALSSRTRSSSWEGSAQIWHDVVDTPLGPRPGRAQTSPRSDGRCDGAPVSADDAAMGRLFSSSPRPACSPGA